MRLWRRGWADRWLGRWLLRLERDASERGYERPLLALGVMQRAPDSWLDSPRILPLPRGSAQAPVAPGAPPTGLTGPWPRAPWVDPAFYPSVLPTDAQDRRDHVEANVRRYLGQIAHYAPLAALRALRGPRLVPVSDARLVEILTQTSLGQFVSLALEERDRAAFRSVLAPAVSHAKVDLSFMPTEELLPGLHAAPTVTLLRHLGPDRYEVAAISLQGRVLLPGEPGWELAKYFVLQGAQLRLVVSAHPRLHFPNDAVLGVTRTALSQEHPLRRLLTPHGRYTLGLHEGVIHHRRSAIHNSQREWYAAFPFTTEGQHKLVASGHHGVAGHADWQPYRFSDGLFGEHVPYGRFRRDWFEEMSLYVDDALRHVRVDDTLRAWADHLAGWVEGFPDASALATPGTLVRTVASYLAAVSVYHSGDHYSYSTIPLEEMPWRLRRPPHDPGPWLPDELLSPEDTFRQVLCHAMFFRPWVVCSLREAAPELPEARVFRVHLRRMDRLDARWEGSSFPPSREIAASLQY
jgi:hypothetical protein